MLTPQVTVSRTVLIDAWMLKATFSDVVARSCTITFNSVFI